MLVFMEYDKKLLEFLHIHNRYEKYKTLWGQFMSAVKLSLNEESLLEIWRFQLNEKPTFPELKIVSDSLQTLDFAGCTLFIGFCYNDDKRKGIIKIGFFDEFGEKCDSKNIFFDELGNVTSTLEETFSKSNIISDANSMLSIFYSYLIEVYQEYIQSKIV